MTADNWIAIAGLIATVIVTPFITTWAQIILKDHRKKKATVRGDQKPPPRGNRNARAWRHVKDNWLVFVVIWLGLWLSINILTASMVGYAVPIFKAVIKYGAIGQIVVLIALLWQTRIRISD